MKPFLAKILTSAIVVATIAGSFGPMTAAQAATTNTLIKGSGSTVYWYASNGKRYVFPNEKTWYSWYPNFNQPIQLVSDYDLAQIPLAGNVTYRPGYKLVKVQTDPRVYAVSRYGVLRWVVSGDIAAQLYGSNWTTRIDDIPDTFFTNYTVGSPINYAWDYNVSNEYNGVSIPSDNISGVGYGTYTYPYTSTYPTNYSSNLTMNVTNRYTSGNTETVTVNATLANYSGQVQNLYIYDESGSLLATCPWSSSCSATITNTQYATRNVYARAYLTNGTYLESQHINVSTNSNYNNNYNNYNYTNYTLNADRTQVNSGSTLSLTFTANNPTTSIQRVEIRDTRDNTLITSCTYANTCTATPYVYSRYGQSQDTVRYIANVYDVSGNLIIAQSSPTITINGTSYNYNSNFTGTASITANRTTANVGDQVQLSASAYTPNTSSGNVTIRLYDDVNGTLIQTCSASNSCSAYPTITSNMNGRQVRYYAVVSDNNGNVLPTVYTNYITVGSQQQTSFTGTVQTTVDQTSVVGGSHNPTFTATVSNYNIAAQNMIVRLYNAANDVLMNTCSGTNTCTYTAQTSAVTTATTLQYYAIASDNYGNTLSRAYSPTVTINPQQQSQGFTGTLSITPDKTGMYSGDTVNLSASLTNSSVATSNVTLQIYRSGGILVLSCPGVTSCSASNQVFYSGSYASQVKFYVIAFDNQGRSLPAVYTNAVTVAPSWKTHITTSNATPIIGATITVTASLDADVQPSSSIHTAIYRNDTGAQIGSCDSRTCSISYLVDSTPASYALYATFTSGSSYSENSGYAPIAVVNQ